MAQQHATTTRGTNVATAIIDPKKLYIFIKGYYDDVG